jgi:two-component system cell cycle response regulator
MQPLPSSVDFHAEPLGVDILIVEDSRTQAEQLEHLLTAHGHRVTLAADGHTALAAMRSRRPQVVITDVVMPRMNGYELCAAMRADLQLRDLPIILLTSLNDPENVVRGLDCGADSFVLKPYDSAFLLSRIHYAVMNQELRRNSIAEMGIEIYFAGRKHFVTSDRMQIVDLLFSTFENAVQKARELDRVHEDLARALARIQALERDAARCGCAKRPGAMP